ncbi:hypothetical protein ACWGCW_12835 [Streptomyces sp. NPDC054933]
MPVALADWRSPYASTAEDSNDFTSEIRSAVDHGDFNDPECTIEMACAAAEASEAVTHALDHQWALYTPQQAATVASALFVQLSATVDSLHNMRQVLGEMAARGDVDRIRTVGQAEAGGGLAQVVGRLGEVAQQLEAVVDGHAEASVRALHGVRSTASLPTNVHETIAAVAALLGESATLNVRHEPGAYDLETDRGFGCGCQIDIMHQGEKYIFGRGDCCWSLVCESDGRPMSDGSVVYDACAELATSLETAHPHQLAYLIQQALPATTQVARVCEQ